MTSPIVELLKTARERGIVRVLFQNHVLRRGPAERVVILCLDTLADFEHPYLNHQTQMARVLQIITIFYSARCTVQFIGGPYKLRVKAIAAQQRLNYARQKREGVTHHA